MKTIQSYRDALKIIASGGLDYEMICLRMAENNPSLFVDVWHEITNKTPILTKKEELDINKNAFNIASSQNKVAAIKYVRGELNLSLKDAAKLINKIIAENEPG